MPFGESLRISGDSKKRNDRLPRDPTDANDKVPRDPYRGQKGNDERVPRDVLFRIGLPGVPRRPINPFWKTLGSLAGIPKWE